jgi:hypothetical protein
MLNDEVVGQRLRALAGITDPQMFRDFLAHLDEYAIGAGRRSLPSPAEGFHVTSADPSDPEAELTLNFGGCAMPLHATTNAFVSVADALDEPWWAAVTTTDA